MTLDPTDSSRNGTNRVLFWFHSPVTLTLTLPGWASAAGGLALVLLVLLALD
jgi:hypothetical protein